MARGLLLTLLAAGAYGFACGTVHGPRVAAYNLVKFPLLILVTASVCAPAWWIFATFLAPELGAVRLRRLSASTFSSLSLLLASLAPVTLFLGLTVTRPRSPEDLEEYPFFLGLNVAFIALAGTIALVRQAIELLRIHGIGVRRGVAVTVAWLAVALVAGGQASWWMRPYFGLAFEESPPFMRGAAADESGVSSFFEAVYRLVIERLV